MKKMLMVLIISLFVTGMSVRVNAQEATDSGYLTIEVIEEAFWDKLEGFDYPINTKEDEYLTWLIRGISKPSTIPAFGNLPYINYSMGGFKTEEIDIERFTLKCQSVINLYNHTHDLQLEMKPTMTSSQIFGIDVKSKDPDYIENMVIMTGEIAHVKEGTVYWESAKNYGSGEHAVTKARVVQVNGVAYLNDNGQIMSSYYGKTPVQIERWTPRMLHISTVEKDLGWVYPTQLTSFDE